MPRKGLLLGDPRRVHGRQPGRGTGADVRGGRGGPRARRHRSRALLLVEHRLLLATRARRRSPGGHSRSSRPGRRPASCWAFRCRRRSAPRSGWRVAFGVLAAGCALTLLLVAVLLPAVAVEPADDRDHPERRARRGRLAAVSVTNALVYLGQYSVYTYIAVILLASGLSAAGVGPGAARLGGLGLVGTWFAGVTLDRRPRSSLLDRAHRDGRRAHGARVRVPRAWSACSRHPLCGAPASARCASSFQTAAIRTRGATPDLIGATRQRDGEHRHRRGAALGGLCWPASGLGWAAVLRRGPGARGSGRRRGRAAGVPGDVG